jgi:UDP-N-acetylglucosamine--N-acetylmuramyl-(pentapeptide) pyrophosphoryl-undecaprenol N-acetylglucosamine transferase
MEERIVAANGLAFASIKAGKFRRDHFASGWSKVLNAHTLPANARDAVRTLEGVGAALKILRGFKPDVVFLKGGYVSLPVGVAARMLRIPYVIHESDVSPGLANRWLGKWATKIAVGFPPKSYHDFDPGRIVYTGNPVRTELIAAHRLEGLAMLHLDETLPVVFVTGGSGGARQINEAVVAALPKLLKFAQVVHVAGEHEVERVKFEVGRLGKLRHTERYHLHGFLMAEMGPGLAAADVVVARAGATTISELAVMGKPTVLIPNYEMAGHQVENAKVLARRGAVRVLDGSKLTGESLAGEMKRLLDDPEELERLSKAIRPFGRTDAAEALAQVILSVGPVSAPVPPQEPQEPAADGGEVS